MYPYIASPETQAAVNAHRAAEAANQEAQRRNSLPKQEEYSLSDNLGRSIDDLIEDPKFVASDDIAGLRRELRGLFAGCDFSNLAKLTEEVLQRVKNIDPDTSVRIRFQQQNFLSVGALVKAVRSRVIGVEPLLRKETPQVQVEQ